MSRLKIPVRVALGSNLEAVQQALLDATKEHPDILSEPAPQVFCTGYGPNSLRFNLLVWISEPHKQFKIKSDLYFRIDRILRDRQVEIPLPQRELHVRTGTVPLGIAPQLQDSLAQLSDNFSLWLKHQSERNPKDSHNGSDSNDK